MAKTKTGSAILNIFANNKVLIIISFVIAVVSWFIYSAAVAPQKTRTVYGVPVKVDISGTVVEKLGLRAYGCDDITVDVEVSGKNYTVGSLKPEDFDVTIQNLNSIDDAGYKLLQISVKPSDGTFSVTSVSKSYIEVFFDFEEEKDIPVEYTVTEPTGGMAGDGYYYAGAFYKSETLTVKGPKSEVDKISGVFADATVESPLTKSSTVKAKIKIETLTGESLKCVDYDIAEIQEISLSIQKTKLLPVQFKFTNLPEYYKNEPLKITYSVPEITIAGTDSQVTSLAVYELAEVDFNTLSPQNNVFEFQIEPQAGIIVIDGTEVITATVDMSGFSLREFDISADNISILNLPYDYSVVSMGKISSVKVVAPSEVITSINGTSLRAEINLSDTKVYAGIQDIPVEIKIENREDCWVVGSYIVKLSLTSVS